MTITTSTRLVAVAAALAAALTACASPATPSVDLEFTDTWVKTIDSGMTAAFGTITNATDHDITIASASTPAARTAELHEVVDGTMQPKQGGFVVPAKGSITLAPGGLHIMLMGVTAPIAAGDDVGLTLTLSDGTTASFTAVAKDFSGANESYDPGGTVMGDMSASPSATPEG